MWAIVLEPETLVEQLARSLPVYCWTRFCLTDGTLHGFYEERGAFSERRATLSKGSMACLFLMRRQCDITVAWRTRGRVRAIHVTCRTTYSDMIGASRA